MTGARRKMCVCLHGGELPPSHGLATLSQMVELSDERDNECCSLPVECAFLNNTSTDGVLI